MRLTNVISPHGRILAGKSLLAFPLFVLASGLSHGQVYLNEVDPDTAGTDRLEFVELYDGGAGNTSLDGYVVVFYNGSNDQSYSAFDLTGMSTNADGFFLIGNTDVPGIDIEIPSNGLQNGEDAVALYEDSDASQFPNGTPVTTSNLVDAIITETGPDTDSGLLVLLVAGGVIDEDANDNKDFNSIGRTNDGGALRDATEWSVLDEPTPGARNVIEAELALFLAPGAMGTIPESGAGNSTMLIVAREGGDISSAATVTFAVDDPTELSVPVSVTIPAGEEQSAPFAVTAIDDLFADGSQAVVVTAESVGLFSATTTITVADDGDAAAQLVINEIYAAGGSFDSTDANGDGTANSEDEFVEIVNISGADFDLSGFQIKESAAFRGFTGAQHVFPANTILPDGCAIVVFGNGAMIDEGRQAIFGGALVQRASSEPAFGLDLTDAGDIVSVQNPAGMEVVGVSYTDGSGGSLSRNPDLTGSFGISFVTPGYLNSDGFTPFCPIPNEIMLSAVPDPATEGGADGTLTISLSLSVTEDTTIFLTSSDTTEATVAASVIIANGMDTVTTPISYPDDQAGDGNISVTITADSPGLLTGSVTFTVNDDGDAPVDLVINEVDYDQEGTDNAEFVEVYDGGVGSQPLDGFVIVAYNGNGGGETAIADLSGMATNASGFFAAFFPPNSLQNGPNEAVALWRGASGTDFEGTTADSPPAGAVLIDAVVYENAGGDPTFASLNYSGPDLADSNAVDSPSLSRLPDGTGDFALATPPTPDASNGSAPQQGYAVFAAMFPGIGPRTNDFDLDGISNLLEFALGLDPTVADVSGLPVGTINGSGQLQLTVTKGPLAGGDSNTTFAGTASTDLITWSTTDTMVVTETDSQLIVVYTGSAAVAYLRLEVTESAP